MRWIGPLAVLLAFSSSALRTTAGELAQAHPVLSGFATNALVQAYHASGLDTNISAPLRLRSYVVTIYTSGDDWIMFNDTASMEVHNILVAARTASVVWRAGDPGAWGRGILESHHDGGSYAAGSCCWGDHPRV